MGLRLVFLRTFLLITAVQVEGLTDTYYLKLRDRDTYLTADGTALKWTAYTGEKEQMFTILEPGTGSDGSDSGADSDTPDSKLVTKFIPATRITILKIAKRRAALFPKSRFTIVPVF